jgi:electron transfer flavoprotein alpha subunit
MGVSSEILGKACQLAEKLGVGVAAVLLGEKVEGLAKELIAYGAGKVYLVEDPLLRLYQSDLYTTVISELVKRHKPEILLLGATAVGMDLAPAVAARVDTGLTAHCVDLTIEEVKNKSLLVAAIPGFGGKIMVKIACPEKRPQMATVKAGMMEKPSKDEKRQGQIVREKFELKPAEMRARTLEMVEEKPVGIPLEEAETVVSVGWGVQSAANLNLAKEIAGLLRAAWAGTRPAVDRGWVPEEAMIGQSGKLVSPKLFISLGASGAMAYAVGFLKSKVVLAVDKNPDAPIFEMCDIGIVADLSKLLPPLAEEFKQAVS